MQGSGYKQRVTNKNQLSDKRQSDETSQQPDGQCQVLCGVRRKQPRTPLQHIFCYYLKSLLSFMMNIKSCFLTMKEEAERTQELSDGGRLETLPYGHGVVNAFGN